MSEIFVFDGSLDGLMCALRAALSAGSAPDAIAAAQEFEDSLFAAKVVIENDRATADEMTDAIVRKISPAALHRVLYAFLSDSPGAADAILEYVRFGLKIGPRVNDHLCDRRVMPVHRLYSKVLCEKHRLLGMLRFQKLEGDVFYARIEPDHNVVGLLSPHFARRMPALRWIIHDPGRGIASVHDAGRWTVAEISIDREPGLAEGEERYQELWRTFYRSIAIETRTNPRLRKSFMPVRYWKYLTELHDDPAALNYKRKRKNGTKSL